MLPFLYKYILPIAFLLVFISEHSLSQDTSKINLLPKDSVIVAKDSAVVKDTAAVKIDTASIDYRFKVAIQTGFDGKYSKSIAMCKRILKEKPDYHEVRLFMGRAYAWDHQWENAKKEISKVIEKEPKNVDAYNAITDVGLWSLIPEMALEKANKGLTIDSVNQDLMLKKAKALEQLGDIDGAIVTLEKLLKINPENLEAQEMLARLKQLTIKNYIGVYYTLEAFSRYYEPRHLVSVEFKHTFNYATTLIARTNFGNRFGRKGLQYELDLYRNLRKGMYVYANIGYSPSIIFPLFSNGAELYKALKRGFDCSVGYRYMLFKSPYNTLRLTILTGSLGKYHNTYWFGFKPYLTFSSKGFAQYYMLMARKYLEDTYNHLTLSIAYGASPYNTSQNLQFDRLYNLKTQRIGLAYQKTFDKIYVLLAGVSLERQELNFQKGDYIAYVIFDLGFRVRF